MPSASRYYVRQLGTTCPAAVLTIAEIEERLEKGSMTSAWEAVPAVGQSAWELARSADWRLISSLPLSTGAGARAHSLLVDDLGDSDKPWTPAEATSTRFTPSKLRGIVLAIGSGLLLVSVALRLLAYQLAWPTSYAYSGARGDTVWAAREAALHDIAVVGMLLGVGLIVIVVHNLLPPRG